VARAAAPNEILTTAKLEALPIAGAAVRDGRLYVAQTEQSYRWWWGPILAADGEGSTTAPLVLSIFDLGQLPALPALSSTTFQISQPSLGTGVQMLFPMQDLLVLTGGGGWWGPILWRGGLEDAVVALPAAGGVAARGVMPWYWGGGGGGRLVAIDVEDPAAPALLSEVDLRDSEGRRWFGATAFTAEGLVYLSHQESVFVEGLVPGGGSTGSDSGASGETPGNGGEDGTVPGDDKDPGDPTDPTDPPDPPDPVGTWVQRSYLDVVDYGASPAAPVVRDPVNIPGQLEGISHSGAMLYTRRQPWDPVTNTYSQETIEASAYDGTQAFLVAALPLPASWPHPTWIDRGVILLGRPAEAADTGVPPGSLEAWALSDSREFALLGKIGLGLPASSLGAFGDLLVAGESDGSVELFDRAEPGALKPLGKGKPSGCGWYDLSGADGDVARGLWVPLGYEGVAFVPIAGD